MSASRLFIFSIVILFFSSCKQRFAAGFDVPQPDNYKNLPSFPQKFLGDYYNKDDSSQLHITGKRITLIRSFSHWMKNEEVDSNWTIKNAYIIYLPTGERFKITKQERDSFYVNFESIDTLFQIDRDHLLRRKKSYYYLNTLMNNGGWGVERLHLENKRLNYHSLSEGDDVDKLKEITGQDTDTIPFHLSKKQFRAFIRKGGFEEEDVFIKN